jgi:hypothetical protein
MKTILTLLSILLLTGTRSAQTSQASIQPTRASIQPTLASIQPTLAGEASLNVLVNKPLPEIRQSPIEKFMRSAKP